MIRCNKTKILVFISVRFTIKITKFLVIMPDLLKTINLEGGSTFPLHFAKASFREKRFTIKNLDPIEEI
ncbi:MAG: hypothetical protein CMP12_09930 [Zunongwangia sp.]|uniref:Uncharacterized protein n=1 Tax=Zunongwangia profunda TaxID=398743 RepID=A0A3D5IZ30_9FLAO|nr:hypothetical protein [Zunongwangia sp.]MAS71110.1 hypothetical protein [Zunongwangia sp.]HCV80997.1 hypothetical protein [Zunongwangia profunda]